MPNTENDITYLATAAIIKSAGNLKLSEDSKIELWLPAAQQDVVQLIGQDKYDELLDLEDTDIKKKIAALGEANYCLAYLVPNLNNASSGNGFTKSSGVGDGKIELLSQSDIENMVTRFRDEALKLLSGFVTKADPDAETNPSTLNAGPLKFACP
jgi:hypothetical protein